MIPPNKTVHHFLGLPFELSNRCISDFANNPSKFLASLGTSDMPKTLVEM